jgi:adenine-specific DNA-methyltransferase
MPTLTWTGKEDALRAASLVPFRLLEPHQAVTGDPDATGSIIGDPETVEDRLLIQGDNLVALKALLPYYAGRVKCIYIDPPYNTGSAFEHYDDNLEHSTWLSMMYPRLELLRELLTEDGSIWISVDDWESHYIKAVVDEIIGRSNFILDISWKKRDGAPNDRKIASIHEHILVWSKSKKSSSKQTLAEETFNLMPRTEKADAQYQVFTEPGGPDPRGAFRKIDTTANGKGGRFVESLYYGITNPYTNEVVWPRKGTCWRHNKEEMVRLQSDRRLYWGVKGTATTPMRKLFRFEAKEGMTTPSIWDDLSFNQHASSEIEKIFGEKAAFDTPKPENLIQRIVHISTNPGDIVLDSFLGSGTTAAVAHKMGRRWIGIEMGDHAVTHCLPRLRKVIAGEQGGISEAVAWKGGGGFRFVKLGETLFDAFGRLNPKVKFADLAAFIWWRETKAPAISGAMKTETPFLGVHEGRGLYLLYNGILGDARPKGGNVLTPAILSSLPKYDGPRIIYGEATTYNPASLTRMNIKFRQIPYDLGSLPLLAEGALEFAAGLVPETSSTQNPEVEGSHV